jgi:hypothetical protein
MRAIGRSRACAIAAAAWGALALGGDLAAQRPRPSGAVPGDGLALVLGRPTDRSVTLSLLPPADLEVQVEYGAAAAALDMRTPESSLKGGEPAEIVLDRLQPDTRYYYRVRTGRPGEKGLHDSETHAFHTQRAPGRPFTFAVQGDSHPERAGRMFDAELYKRTLERAARDQPDFYLLMGDDFSIDPLIARGQLTQRSVDDVYLEQRRFLATVGQSAPLFLVNGNHEQAARYLLKGTSDSAPLFAGRARNRFFPLPAPDAFYGGNTEPIEGIGFLRDYYAWTWGDALFVVIDPYWHSPVQVDSAPGGGGGNRAAGQGGRRGTERQQGRGGGGRERDWWGISIGDAQYRWLKKTLEESRARYKFVFAHHVMGTGRGGVEQADLYEWGGRDPAGRSTFAARRPGWELPIHQLMVKTGVTIFFQGHDHLFARQEKDGVIYQEVPNPADGTYTAFNEEAYRSGDTFPNSGYLRVRVAPEGATVEYVRMFLPRDEQPPDRVSGTVQFRYASPARR